MTCLDKYLEAVARRRAIERTGCTRAINYPAVAVMQDQDIPALTEMVRLLNNAVAKLVDYAENIDDEEVELIDIVREHCKAFLKVEELAASGDCHVWGNYGRDTKQRDADKTGKCRPDEPEGQAQH